MKISIALCTRNGDKYLRTQLSSFLDQTRLPDEIIVCDEKSTDETINILKEYEDRLPIKIYINENQLGTYKNFEKAVSLCSGDIIFLADQDDFWEKQKLERVSVHFKQNPKVDVIFTNGLLVNEFGEIYKGIHLWQIFGFSDRLQKLFKEGLGLKILLEGNRATGCTMAIRKPYAKKLMPFPLNFPKRVLHDAYIALMATVEGKIDFLPAKYIQYRLHSNQQVGVFGEKGQVPGIFARLIRPRKEKAKPYLEKLEILGTIKKELIKSEIKIPLELDEMIDYLYNRSHLPKNRIKRLPLIGRLYYKGYYHKYKNIGHSDFQALLTMIGDIIEP